MSILLKALNQNLSYISNKYCFGFIFNTKLLSVCMVLAAATVVTMMPEALMAASTIENTICNVVGQLSGGIARGIAAIAIIFLGFSLFLGKISWGLALALAIGIGAIFGAKEIVNMVGGTGNACQ